jgi:hypothetical protein
MTWKTIRYNRNVLYEQVWADSMLTVAKSYGVSNVGLAKICRRLRVPIPWRGYWEKVRNGEQIKKPTLAPLRSGEQEEYVVERYVKPTVDPEHKAEFELAAAREKAPEHRIMVPPTLVQPHRLVVQAEKSLRKGRRDEYGRFSPGVVQRLDIRVSRPWIDRALIITDSLLKALQARGFTVSVGVGENASTCVDVLGQPLDFWLEEQLDCSRIPLSKKQEEEKKEHPWMYSRPEYRYDPNGRLALRIGQPNRSGGRRTWADGAKQKLENCLNKFIGGLLQVAESELAYRQEDERWHREREERERREREEQQRQEEERKRSEQLLDQVDRWDRSRRIREYIADMRSNTLNPEKWNIAKVPLVEWMEWALKYAEKIDPVGPLRKDRELKITPPPISDAGVVDPLLPDGGAEGEIPEGGH